MVVQIVVISVFAVGTIARFAWDERAKRHLRYEGDAGYDGANGWTGGIGDPTQHRQQEATSN